MKLRRTILALGAVAALAIPLAACDADYYGGYNPSDGIFWRNKGICNTMTPYGAVVGDLACYYTRPVPGPAIQYCAHLANGAFPSRGYDSYPSITWLLRLCGNVAPGQAAGYFD